MVAFQKRLEDLWSGTRWLTELVTFARSKDGTTLNLGVLQTILDSVGEHGNVKVKLSSRDRRSSKSQPSPTNDSCNLDSSGVGGDMKPVKLKSSNSSEKYSSADSVQTPKQSSSDPRSSRQGNGKHSGNILGPSDKLSQLTKATDNLCDRFSQSGKRRRASHDHSTDYEHLLVETRETRQSWHVRIFIALDCHVGKGQSITVVASQATTARDILDHVASTVTTMANRQHGHVSTGIEADGLCLVCVIGARERILRDSFHLAHLQSPWTDGHLYVRQRTDRLAALELEKVIASLM